MPRLPDVFGQPDVADLAEHFPHDRRHLLRALEARPGLRVDVDPQLVGVVDVGLPRGPGMEVERAEVRRPHHLRDLAHAQRVGVPPGGERHAHGLDPIRAMLGYALLVDRLGLGAVRVALEVRRPVAERPDDAVADRAVVLDEVELRLLARPEVDLVGVGHPDDPSLHVELDER